MVGSDVGEVDGGVVVVGGSVLSLSTRPCAVKTLTWSGPLKSPSTHWVMVNVAGGAGRQDGADLAVGVAGQRAVDRVGRGW